MSRYKDGKIDARLGDIVRGPTHNSGGRMVVGTVISLSPNAESANCQIAYTDVFEAKSMSSWQTGTFVRTPKGEEFLVVPHVDFADTKSLDRLSEALAGWRGAAAPMKAARAAGR